MSVHTVPRPDRPPVASSDNTWFFMEALLATAQVHDLLVSASTRLERLQRDVPLSPQAIDDVDEARRSIAIAASKLDAVRHISLA